ncbi:MAG: hypothetical protein GAK34_02452 [Delftia tsuruhatensis]|nr:MAG: hypothetical protein GAK34_02452 [Delftia tsuruhatensis]
MGPGREAGQRARQHARHMEQRVAVDGAVGRVQALHLHAGPGAVDLGAMRLHGDLGRTRGAPGMEVGRHVAGLGLAPAHQPVGGLGGQGGVQIAGGPALSIPLGSPTFMRDPEHMRQIRIQRRDFLADAGIVLVRPGDQKARARGPHQGRDLLGTQQRIDGLHDARRLAAPQRKVVLHAAGQQDGHRVAGAHAQRMQGVGRLVDLAQQFGIAQVPGIIHAAGLGQKAQRPALAVLTRGVAKQVVDRLRRDQPGHGLAFDGLHIGQGTHGPQGPEHGLRRNRTHGHGLTPRPGRWYAPPRPSACSRCGSGPRCPGG